MTTTNRYLNKLELAEKLGLKKRGVDELMRTHKIPFIASGHRTVRFSWAAVEKALAKFERKAVGED